MPYKRRVSFRRRRGGAKRRTLRTIRYRRKSLSMVPRQLALGCAPKQYVKLPYAFSQTLTIPISGGISNVIQIQSSLFDPEPAIGGHQPRYFDQWAAFYNKYTVFGMKIRLRFVNVTNGSQPVICSGFWSCQNNPSISGIADFTEARYTIGSKLAHGYPAGPSVVNYTTYQNVARMHGYKSVADNPDFSATTSANPANMLFFQMAVGPVGAVYAGVTNVPVDIRVIYYVKFEELIDQVAS